VGGGKLSAGVFESGVVVVYHFGRSAVSAERFTISGQAQVAHVAFAPDGVTLAAADNDGSVYLYDTASGRQTGTVAVAKPVDVVAFNPIGTLLATGDSSGSVRLWDARTLAPVGETMEARVRAEWPHSDHGGR